MLVSEVYWPHAMSFKFSNLTKVKYLLDKAILMRTHNIQFHDKIRKFPKIFVFLSYWKNFIGTQKRVRITHGKQAIGTRAIEV